jgi:hypothetical protein
MFYLIGNTERAFKLVVLIETSYNADSHVEICVIAGSPCNPSVPQNIILESLLWSCGIIAKCERWTTTPYNYFVNSFT